MRLQQKKLPYKWILPLPIMMILYAVFSSPVDLLLKNFLILLTFPIPGVHDYFATAGLSAPIFNAGLLGLLVLGMLKYNKLPMNANAISALFLMIGFGFIGKNTLNFIPFLIGGYIYSKIQKITFKRVLVASLLSSCLAPLIDFSLLLSPFNLFINYLIAAFVGILIGMISVPVSSHVLLVHQGYNLYNMGYAAGFIGIVFSAVLKGLGLDMKNLATVSDTHSIPMLVILSSFFLYCIILGFITKQRPLKDYYEIFSLTGRLVTDFTRVIGPSLTMINIGIMGLIAVGFVVLFQGILNGPIIAGIFTLAGFASFGNHPKNTLPIMLGALFGVVVINQNLSLSSGIAAILFGTTLAPIAGEYGIIAGLFVGALHTTLVSNTAAFHSGMNLYNNGFSGGLIATFIVPILDAYKKER